MVWGGVRRRATLALGRLVCTVGCGEYYVPPRAVASVLRAPCHVMGRGTWGGCRRGLSLHVPGLSACPFVCWGRAVDPHSPIGTPWDADTHDSRWVPRHKNHPTHSSYRREARFSVTSEWYLVNSAADSAFCGHHAHTQSNGNQPNSFDLCAAARARRVQQQRDPLSNTPHRGVRSGLSLSHPF